MKNLNFITAFVALFLSTGIASAHALYIDANPEAKLGERQEVKVYYSEFADGTVENVSDWYSDVAEFKLWLVKPNGERVELKTEAQQNHVAAHFVPTEEGIYRLQISHTTADVADGTAYQFNTAAQVSVGNSKEMAAVSEKAPDLLLVEDFSNSKKSKFFKVYFKGEPKEGVAATLFLPSGAKKELKSNSEGIFEVNSEEKGIHFLEATTYHENEAGKTKKEAYKATWRASTRKIIL